MYLINILILDFHLDSKFMVPMTNSLFIPGKLTNESHLIIEIGAGFFIKRTIEDANDFLLRKSANIKIFFKKLGESIMMQTSYMENLEGIMRQRLELIKREQDER